MSLPKEPKEIKADQLKSIKGDIALVGQEDKEKEAAG